MKTNLASCIVLVLLGIAACTPKISPPVLAPDSLPKVKPDFTLPPELGAPANRAEFPVAETETIEFSWSALQPAPDTYYKYRLLIAMEIPEVTREKKLKNLKVIFAQDLGTDTSARIPVETLWPDPEPGAEQSFRWSVQALDSLGVPICQEDCISPRRQFTLSSIQPDFDCEIQVQLVRLRCARPAYPTPDSVSYEVSIQITNLSQGNGSGATLNWWFDHTAAGPATFADQINIWDGSSFQPGYISNLSPATLPTNLPYLVSQSVSFTLTVPLGITAVDFIPFFHTQASIPNLIPPPATIPSCMIADPLHLKLEPCVCDPCKKFKVQWPPSGWLNWVTGTPSASSDPDFDIFTINDQFISVNNANPIIQVQAEIVGFLHVFSNDPKGFCLNNCNRQSSSHAEFVGLNNTLSGAWQNGGSPVDFIDQSGDTESRGIRWVSNSSGGIASLNGTNIHLEVGIPNLHPQSDCCRDCFVGIIRYSFMDSECQVCEVERIFFGCHQ